MNIGERIKKLRNDIGLSQTELADKIGVSKQTLYKYENGIVTNIPSDKIELLAKYLNTTPAFLMGWTYEGVKSLLGTSLSFGSVNNSASKSPEEPHIVNDEEYSVIEGYRKLDINHQDMIKQMINAFYHEEISHSFKGQTSLFKFDKDNKK